MFIESNHPGNHNNCLVSSENWDL